MFLSIEVKLNYFLKNNIIMPTVAPRNAPITKLVDKECVILTQLSRKQEFEISIAAEHIILLSANFYE